MSNLVPTYFFPGPESSTISTPAVMDLVRAAGLEPVIGDFVQSGHASTSAVTGPDKGPGWCVCQEPTTAGYYEGEQDWHFIKPKNFWLGIRKGNQPTPADLQRGPKTMRDYAIKLRDSNEWDVPALYPFGRAGSLPRIGKMGEDCEWKFVIDPKYNELLKEYEPVYAGKSDTRGGWMDLAIKTLAINYRIDKYLAMVLELMYEQDSSNVIDLAMDVPERDAYTEAKKKDIERSAVSVTSAGDAILPPSPVSLQPMPTSDG